MDRRQLEAATALYESSRDDVMPYLRERGISPATAERFRLGLVKDPISGHEHVQGRLSIPGIGFLDRVYSLRFRAVSGEEPKYLGLPGETRLFNLRSFFEAADTICLTEGELDTISLEQCGYQSVGVCGANSWKQHHPRMFAGFSKVFVFGDGDKAGREFIKSVSETLRQSVAIRLPEGEDVNSTLVSGGEEAVHKLLEQVSE